jgi:hypothetical protein
MGRLLLARVRRLLVRQRALSSLSGHQYACFWSAKGEDSSFKNPDERERLLEFVNDFWMTTFFSLLLLLLFSFFFAHLNLPINHPHSFSLKVHTYYRLQTHAAEGRRGGEGMLTRLNGLD